MISHSARTSTDDEKAADEPHSDAAYLREAVAHAEEIMAAAAVERINARFGKGYAEAHPELIAGFMQAAAADMAASVIARSIEFVGSDPTAHTVTDLALMQRNPMRQGEP